VPRDLARHSVHPRGPVSHDISWDARPSGSTFHVELQIVFFLDARGISWDDVWCKVRVCKRPRGCVALPASWPTCWGSRWRSDGRRRRRAAIERHGTEAILARRPCRGARSLHRAARQAGSLDLVVRRLVRVRERRLRRTPGRPVRAKRVRALRRLEAILAAQAGATPSKGSFRRLKAAHYAVRRMGIRPREAHAVPQPAERM
jgi:hypothetical protein